MKLWQCKKCNEIGLLMISRRDKGFILFTCYCSNCGEYFDSKITEDDLNDIIEGRLILK
jgi:transcription elongation factor Elf1